MSKYFKNEEQELKFLKYLMFASIIVLVLLIILAVIEFVPKKEPIEPTPAPKVIVYQCQCDECQKTPVERAAEIAELIREATEVEVDPIACEEIDPIVYYDVPLDKELQDHIFDICQERELDPALVFGMIKKESWYTADLEGDGGNSIGLMQVQPRWHQERMDKLGVTDLKNPYQNVEVALDYLDELFDEGKSLEWTLMAYNGGPSGANKNEANGIVTNYVKVVKQYTEELEECIIYG